MARRLEARPGPAFTPWASCPALASINAETAPNFARNSPATVSNIEFRSLELQRFRTLLKLRPIEYVRDFGGGARLRNGVRTGALVAFSVQRVAGLKPPSPLLARNVCAALWASKGVARFMRVRERASKGGGGFIWAQKSSPSALKTPQIRRFCACWASFFAERPLEAPCWASFFAEEPLEGPCWASIFAPTGAAPKCRRCRGALQGDCGGGFAPCEALCRRVAGVSEAWMASFPADWWRRGRDLRWCGRQSADPLDKSR